MTSLVRCFVCCVFFVCQWAHCGGFCMLEMFRESQDATSTDPSRHQWSSPEAQSHSRAPNASTCPDSKPPGNASFREMLPEHQTHPLPRSKKKSVLFVGNKDVPPVENHITLTSFNSCQPLRSPQANPRTVCYMILVGFTFGITNSKHQLTSTNHHPTITPITSPSWNSMVTSLKARCVNKCRLMRLKASWGLS